MSPHLFSIANSGDGEGVGCPQFFFCFSTVKTVQPTKLFAFIGLASIGCDGLVGFFAKVFLQQSLWSPLRPPRV
jgi:hypothetical protein